MMKLKYLLPPLLLLLLPDSTGVACAATPGTDWGPLGMPAAWLFPLLLMLGAFRLLSTRTPDSGQGLMTQGKIRAHAVSGADVGVTFDDVAGVDEAVETVARGLPRFREILGIAGLILGAVLPGPSRADSGDADSLELRLGRIRGFIGDLQRELDTLEQAVRGRPGSPLDSGAKPAPEGVAKGPLAAELLTGKARTLAEAAATSLEGSAFGYTLDPLPGIGMHFLRWGKAWGVRAAASARFHESARSGGADVQALRILHRFSLFGALHTRLYALAGAGALWRREPYTPFLGPPGSPRTDRAWHGTADLSMRAVLGAGSEIGLLSLGGIRVAPEIGFQAARYLQRYQDSPSWQAGGVAFPGETRPRSDFALEPYLSLQLSVYFR